MVTQAHKRKMAWLIGIGIGVVMLGYGLFQSRNLILGPQISLTTPTNGSLVTNPLVTVSGTTRNISFISLNDRPIFINQQGDFSEQLVASPGYNSWTLVGKDKFGRTISKHFSLIFNNS